MPGAVIAFDQDRPGPSTSSGSPGLARKDLWVGQVVRPRCTTTGNSSFLWEMLNKPAGSAASISSSTSLACSFLPDMPGTYRIRLTTNGGGAGNVMVLIAACTYNASGVLQNRGWRIPAVGETINEDNYGGNDRGWSADMEFIFADILSVLAGGLGGGSTTGGSGNGAQTRALLYNLLREDPGRNPSINSSPLWASTAITDGASFLAGRALSIVGDHLYVSGYDGANGGLYRFNLGTRTGTKVTTLVGGNNPSDLVVSRDAAHDYIVSLSQFNLNVEAYGTSLVHNGYSTASDWSGGRVAVLNGSSDASLGAGAILWTAPSLNTVYATDYYLADASPVVAATVSGGPSAICVNTEDESVWVACPTGNTINRFTYSPSTRTLVSTHTVSLPSIIDMCFDGTYLWALSSTGVLYRRNPADGTAASNFTFGVGYTVHARSRLCFDGIGVWVTLANGIAARFHPTTVKPVTTLSYGGAGHEFRGIAVAANGDVFVSDVHGTALDIVRFSFAYPRAQYIANPMVRTVTGDLTIDTSGMTNLDAVFAVTGRAVANTITLPANPSRPLQLTVKDVDGTAAALTITLQTSDGSLIDGAATFVMNENYESATVLWTGSQWSIV